MGYAEGLLPDGHLDTYTVVRVCHFGSSGRRIYGDWWM
jgi:hypothetical protein